ncbi:MAG: MogA/MoaB family molybdenum cofactor biosynthesis protein [Armatimonadetes bacterium]|nr:MogA/MoaB family molybdenum cofactor biosynthesis protein [Armatimonadota bacterium]
MTQGRGLAGVRAAVLTASERASRGEGHDDSGDIIVDALQAAGAEVCVRVLVPDDLERIKEHLTTLADVERVDLILTNGGSGLSPRDVTPEATLAVVHRLVPGIPEAARLRTLEKTPLAMLSRSVAGVRGCTLIVNLPGSPKAVREWMDVLLPVLPHAVDLIRGKVFEWGRPHPGPGETLP